MKTKSGRSVYRLGFIDVLHKATGKKIPVSPSLFKNKDRMMQLGYVEIREPEAPQLEPSLETAPTEAPVKKRRKKVTKAPTVKIVK